MFSISMLVDDILVLILLVAKLPRYLWISVWNGPFTRYCIDDIHKTIKYVRNGGRPINTAVSPENTTDNVYDMLRNVNVLLPFI